MFAYFPRLLGLPAPTYDRFILFFKRCIVRVGGTRKSNASGVRVFVGTAPYVR